MKYAKGPPQKKCQPNFLSEVLYPAYYRVEFARRNEAVAEESGELLKLFPRTEKAVGQTKTFSNDSMKGSPVTMLDRLVQEYRASRSGNQEKMRTGLGKFVSKRRVFPFPVFPIPEVPRFMPTFLKYGKPSSSFERQSIDIDRRIFVWGSLVEFEMFLLAEDFVSRPILMPVVPLHPSSKRQTRDGKAARESHMQLVVALNQTSSRLTENFEMLLHLLGADAAMAQPDKSMIKANRTPFGSFDDYLDAHDFDQEMKTSSESESQKLIAITYFQKRGDRVSANAASQVTTFDRWIKDAAYWIKNYVEIV